MSVTKSRSTKFFCAWLCTKKLRLEYFKGLPIILYVTFMKKWITPIRISDFLTFSWDPLKWKHQPHLHACSLKILIILLPYDVLIPMYLGGIFFFLNQTLKVVVKTFPNRAIVRKRHRIGSIAVSSKITVRFFQQQWKKSLLAKLLYIYNTSIILGKTLI